MNLDNVTLLEIIGPGGTEFSHTFDKGVTAITSDGGETLRIYVGERTDGVSREVFLASLSFTATTEDIK